MKICVAQTRSVTGEVRKNIDKHKEFTGFAVSGGADIIVFPELSLTGYEPTLANKLATNEGDDRFRDLQYLSDNQKIIIAAGIPIKKEQGVMIGMIIFRPNQPQQTYFKQYLHPDEERYFIKGTYEPVLSEYEIAMAICYEISVPLHAEQAHKNEARVYIASVAKTIAGIGGARVRCGRRSDHAYAFRSPPVDRGPAGNAGAIVSRGPVGIRGSSRQSFDCEYGLR